MKRWFVLLLMSSSVLFALTPYEVSKKIDKMTFEEYKAYKESDEYKNAMGDGTPGKTQKTEAPKQADTPPPVTRSPNLGNIEAVTAGTAPQHAAKCEKFIVLHSAGKLAEEYGVSEAWIEQTGKMIAVWEKPTPEGKGRKVGEMHPGSHAKMLEEGPEDYKIVSPYDKSVGWVNKNQVAATTYQDTVSREVCTPRK